VCLLARRYASLRGFGGYHCCDSLTWLEAHVSRGAKGSAFFGGSSDRPYRLELARQGREGARASGSTGSGFFGGNIGYLVHWSSPRVM
jgi:hypothetical protein